MSASFVADVDPSWSLDAWRQQARQALAAAISPENVQWDAGTQASLLLAAPLPRSPAAGPGPRVPASLIELANTVLCHRDQHRHALLYRLLWRLTHGTPRLMERATDADVVVATGLAQAVRRDSHKMKAFVRFRKLTADDDADEAYVAWFEPDHFIVDRVAPFFARRFAGMRWAILTPYRSVSWDGGELTYGAGAARSDAPADDAQEELWRTYYANIFNPARLNPTMMRQEMPQKYWKGLPEVQALPVLLRDAGNRVREMAERPAQPVRRRIPEPAATQHAAAETGLAGLRAAAATCRRCALWQPATATVWGEGPQDARVMIIGEQPGDQEDLTGRPFVGPSGQLLDRALAELGIARSAIYLTNAVKHFRFEQRGKIRLHRSPEAAHVDACRAWLQGELAAISPDVVVCLGATAATTLFGRDFRLLAQRGTWRETDNGTRAFATVHPSWILRQRTPREKEDAYRGFVDDLSLLTRQADTGP